MLRAQKAYIAIMVVALLIVGGTAAWLFCGQTPKKAPVRAKQVMADNIAPQFAAAGPGRAL